MGYAIRRPDGSYRAWNRLAMEDALRVGETWEEMSSPPDITPDPMTDAEKDQAAQNWNDVKLAIRSLCRVIAPKLSPPMTPAQLMQAVRDEYRAQVQ